MRKIFIGTGALAAALLFASSANAAQTLTLSPPAIDGTIAGSFHNDGLVSGLFTDTYNFAFAGAGLVGATISSIFTTGQSNNVDFTSVTFNGTELGILSTGQVEFRALNDLPVLSGLQSLIVSGNSGGSGSYAGTLSFVPGAVPEPSTWAMLLIGFGGIGFAMRNRQFARSTRYS